MTDKQTPDTFLSESQYLNHQVHLFQLSQISGLYFFFIDALFFAQNRKVQENEAMKKRIKEQNNRNKI